MNSLFNIINILGHVIFQKIIPNVLLYMNLDSTWKLKIVHVQVLGGKVWKAKLLDNIITQYLSLDFLPCLSPH